MMKLNKLATMNHNNHNNTNHTNKGGRKMKGTKKIKTRIIAGMLSLVTVFSVGACSVTTASAAGAPSVASIAKDVSNFAIDQVIDKYVTNGIAGSLLKMGTGYLLNWIFDEKEEEKKTVDDAIKEIDKLRQTMEENHKEEMNSLKVINGSIDTQTFRKAADSLHDDYSTVLEKISNNARNITASGEGKINENTYKAYKAILADSTCNLSKLEKNFRVMRDYVLGKRLSTNRQSGYEATTKYLFDKVTEKYKETAHSWKDSLDYLKVVRNNINGELTTIHFDAGMDYITMLTLNNMAYKVREYEIDKGIYKVSEGEYPYANYEGVEKNLSQTMQAFNDAYKKAIDDNNNDNNMVKTIVTLSEPVDGIQEKGFQSFTEAWAQASATDKDFTISQRIDFRSDKDNGFNFDKLDQNKYGFTPQGGYHVKEGRNITVDLGGHTIDNSDRPNASTFGFKSNTTLNIKNGTVKGGENALRADGSTNVTVKMDDVTVDDTAWAGIYFGANGIGKANAKNMVLEMNNCTIKNAKKESGVRMIPDDSTLIVNNCTFENNTSCYDGGAIHLESKKEATITDSTFKNNIAENGFGGAIAAIPQDYAGSSVKVEGGLFEGNVSNKFGPCFHYDPETRFKGAGGAIAGSNLHINNATFKNNSTNDQGGAIYSYNYNEQEMTDTAITNCTFEGNSSKHVGGAIRMFHLDDKSFVKNCNFVDNTSEKGANVFVQYGHDLGEQLRNEWGNTSNAASRNGMYVQNQ